MAKDKKPTTPEKIEAGFNGPPGIQNAAKPASNVKKPVATTSPPPPPKK